MNPSFTTDIIENKGSGQSLQTISKKLLLAANSCLSCWSAVELFLTEKFLSEICEKYVLTSTKKDTQKENKSKKKRNYE